MEILLKKAETEQKMIKALSTGENSKNLALFQ